MIYWEGEKYLIYANICGIWPHPPPGANTRNFDKIIKSPGRVEGKNLYAFLVQTNKIFHLKNSKFFRKVI